MKYPLEKYDQLAQKLLIITNNACKIIQKCKAKMKGEKRKKSLFVHEFSPEMSLSPQIWIRRQQWCLIRPDLIDVLDYYQGLTNRLVIMKQNRYVLVYLLEKIMLCRRIILLQICCFYYHYMF
jgi:hypothetical protein